MIGKKQVAKDLIAARDLILERGWNTGRLVGYDGSLCALGGLLVAVKPEFGHRRYATFNDLASFRIRRARRELQKNLPAGYHSVWKFNDARHDARHRDDVIELFNKTIEGLGINASEWKADTK
jgi:hypothetical protein